MAQPQEQSEAKLLAYIEGDLDADSRAEIERHLEANPQHRQMLDELARTRDLVRWLPKETAPPELLEQVQSQLERTSLLDESHGRETNRLRINRWPHIRAVAAVLVLASGLGAAIYFALPPRKPGGTAANSVALQKGKREAATDPATRLEEEREGERTDGDSRFYAKTRDRDFDSRGTTQPADAAGSVALGGTAQGGAGGFGGGGGRGPGAPVLGRPAVAAKEKDAQAGQSDGSGLPSTPAAGSRVGTELAKAADAPASADRFRESVAAKTSAEQHAKRGAASPEVLALLAPGDEALLSQTARNAWLVPDVRRAVAATEARGVNGAAVPAARPQALTRDQEVVLRTAIPSPASKPATPATPLFLVVSSPDPDATGRQIAGYLSVNRIPTDTLDGSALAQVNALQEQSARYSFNYPRSPDGSGPGGSGGPGPAGGATFEHKSTADSLSAGRGGAAAARGRTADRAIQPGAPSGPPAAADAPATVGAPGAFSSQQGGSATHPAGAMASRTPAPSAPAAAAAQSGRAREDGGVAGGAGAGAGAGVGGGTLGDRAKVDAAARRGSGLADAADPYGALSQRSTESIAPAPAPVSKMLIARRMTRGQARELQNRVNQPNQLQLAMVFDESGIGRQNASGGPPLPPEPGGAPNSAAGAPSAPALPSPPPPPSQQPSAAPAAPLPAPPASPAAAAAAAPAAAGRATAPRPDAATPRTGSSDQKNAAIAREEVERAAAPAAPAPAPGGPAAEASPSPAPQSANQSQRDLRVGQSSDKTGTGVMGKPGTEGRRPATLPLATVAAIAAPERPAPPRGAGSATPATAPAVQPSRSDVVQNPSPPAQQQAAPAAVASLQARDEDLDQPVDVIIVVQQSASVPPVTGTTAAGAAAPPATAPTPAAASPVDSTKR